MTELYILRLTIPADTLLQNSYIITHLVNQPYLIERGDKPQQSVYVKWTMQPYIDGCLHDYIEFNGSTPFNEDWILLYSQKLKKVLLDSFSDIKMEVTRRLSFSKCIM
jgi:hypothetical protein